MIYSCPLRADGILAAQRRKFIVSFGAVGCGASYPRSFGSFDLGTVL